MEDKKVLYRIKPDFNIMYEMFMPTGKRFRNTFFVLILISICYIFLGVLFEPIKSNMQNIEIGDNIAFDIHSIFNTIFLIAIVALLLKFIIHIVVQVWQYNSIFYTFYNDHLEYEDTFLNQHKKTLMYSNVKEIEIKRTVWDRINGYGIIVIYTNAEKSSSKGLILYGIREPQIVYEKIYQIIHKKEAKIPEEDVIKDLEKESSEAEEIIKREDEFKESLNNKK